MSASTVTDTAPDPLQLHPGKLPFTRDDETRAFPVGRVTISITRVHADEFRVVVTDLRGLAIGCYTATFSEASGRLQIGTTAEQAARNYARGLYRDFRADMEAPAQVVIRRSRALAKAA